MARPSTVMIEPLLDVTGRAIKPPNSFRAVGRGRAHCGGDEEEGGLRCNSLLPRPRGICRPSEGSVLPSSPRTSDRDSSDARPEECPFKGRDTAAQMVLLMAEPQRVPPTILTSKRSPALTSMNQSSQPPERVDPNAWLEQLTDLQTIKTGQFPIQAVLQALIHIPGAPANLRLCAGSRHLWEDARLANSRRQDRTSWARLNSDLNKNFAQFLRVSSRRSFPSYRIQRFTRAGDVVHRGLELPDFIHPRIKVGTLEHNCDSGDLSMAFSGLIFHPGTSTAAGRQGLRVRSTRPGFSIPCPNGPRFGADVVGYRALHRLPFPNHVEVLYDGRTSSPDTDHAGHYCPQIIHPQTHRTNWACIQLEEPASPSVRRKLTWPRNIQPRNPDRVWPSDHSGINLPPMGPPTPAARAPAQTDAPLRHKGSGGDPGGHPASDSHSIAIHHAEVEHCVTEFLSTPIPLLPENYVSPTEQFRTILRLPKRALGPDGIPTIAIKQLPQKPWWRGPGSLMGYSGRVTFRKLEDGTRHPYRKFDLRQVSALRCSDALQRSPLAQVTSHSHREHNRGTAPLESFSIWRRRLTEVWHSGLLFKLIYNQLPRLRTVASFLKDRNFYVNVEDTTSDSHPISAGVSQGSCLSPCLYAVYTNDIPTLADQLQDWEDVILTLYADASAYLATSRWADLAAAKFQRSSTYCQTEWTDGVSL
ncbi:RNA-directed DNA polymerase from mobile element jockey [Eumeta japonica]|uniref:RNA-directed DNA polymerase from mobile element jockey n=1 Tax=Eumeta variegata TaxID=151549 RepID=A0A4C2A575_EUMVA|nr:RNA-directed DNA polymerase from mobile element jockey [Eumeta japonica]